MFESLIEPIFWMWDNESNTLIALDKNGDRIKKKSFSTTPTLITRDSPDTTIQHLKLKFLEAVDNYEQVRFRRHFMRKSKKHEMDVVILQDIKDVVFYLLLTPVPSGFIEFFHTVEVDNFLRGLILYFQYFLEIWNDVQYRRQNVKKLKHPVGIEREMIVTQNLSQLRSIVARDYFLILLGGGSCKHFHHMTNKQKKSIGDRDLRLFEHLFVFATRVVWVAFWRDNKSIIEHEMNRLLRSDYYSLINEQIFTGEETESNKRILYGDIKKEGKLLVRSPLFHEISKDHPTELQQLGLACIPPIRNEKLLKLYDSYTLPEEYLEENELSVGILGHSRRSYEPLLQPKETLIETVKRYTIKSGWPGIFPGRITPAVEKSSNVDTSSYLSSMSSNKEIEKVPSPVISSSGESEDEVEVIIRLKEYYTDLHKKCRLLSLKMWKKHRSL